MRNIYKKSCNPREKTDKIFIFADKSHIDMTIAKKIKQIIGEFSDDYVFTAADFDVDVRQREAVAKALQRMAMRGEILKLLNGKFYKPRITEFGPLKPSPAQIVKEYLVKDGKVNGYLTGASAFAQFSLTTQISSKIQVGTNVYRQPINRGGYKISFVLQPNEITEEGVELMKILDCLRFIKEVPGCTPADACLRMKYVISNLSESEIEKLAKYAMKYTPFVRALCGAIMETLGCDGDIVEELYQSLSGVSRYRLPIPEYIIPTKRKWRIYEPT